MASCVFPHEECTSHVKQIHLEDVWETWQEEEGASWRHGGIGGKLGEVFSGDSSGAMESLGLLR